MKANIILVHGAFAESSSWDDVADKLTEAGHRVTAYANPLHSIATDAAALADLVSATEGPVLLVGHSYGGAVMTNVPADAGDIVGLVYVGAFALEAGESPAVASSLVPGSTLGETLTSVPLSNGVVDLYIEQEKYHQQFCADLPERDAKLMAVSQRPIAEAALGEASGEDPLWKSVPSWFVFGAEDRNIPVGAHRIMADRAGSKRTLEVEGASHVVGISHPSETAGMILEAANSQGSTED